MAEEKKFYAVAVGRNPGIYDNWHSASKQVLGYSHAGIDDYRLIHIFCKMLFTMYLLVFSS
jgi:viroplasmin and RNaseH domain-containing protein